MSSALRKHNNAVPALYGGAWYDSKKALARHIAAEGVLSLADVARLLYPPVDEDLQPRLDYYGKRAVRLRAAKTGPVSGGPLVYAGRFYPNRSELARWFADCLGISSEEAGAMLFALDGGDITGEIEDYCRTFGHTVPPPDPEAFALPITSGNGRNGNADLVVNLNHRDGSDHPLLTADLDPAIAGPLGMIATAFAAQQAELTALRERQDGHTDPVILREIQAGNATLDRLAARLAQLERTTVEQHKDITDQADKTAVILHKVGQLTHDFEQMRSRGTPGPRYTRKRPLGTDP